MPKAVGASIEPTSWDDLVSKLINRLKAEDIEIKGIIFDKDGTLFDIQRSWSEWANVFVTKFSKKHDLRNNKIG